MQLIDFSLFFSGEKHNVELEKMYITCKNEFTAYVHKKYSVDREDIIDIYQESFISLHEKIIGEKLRPENLHVSLKTYLFSICINKLYNYFRDSGKTGINLEALENYPVENTFFDEELKALIWNEVKALGEPCNLVLQLFYDKQENMKTIAALLNYKNEQVAKNKRFSCMELLKKLIKQKYSKDDFFYE